MGFLDATRDHERLLGLLKRLNKVPQELQHLSGFNLSETVDENGVAGLSVVLGGNVEGGRDGRLPKAIPLSNDSKKMPAFKGNRLYRADVEPDGEFFQLVRQQKGDTALRIITTGLLVASDGSTTRDFAEIAKSGRKLRYHGAFPITVDAAKVVGESICGPITAQSKVIADERFGKIKGLAGVPKSREVTLEVVLGGPVLVGQIDGFLRIHELTKNGWKVYDVTNSEYWQKEFMDYAMQDIEYLQALEADEKRRARRKKKITVTKGPPSDHPDAL